MSTITEETSTTDTILTTTDPTLGETLVTATEQNNADGTTSRDVIVTREDKDRR